MRGEQFVVVIRPDPTQRVIAVGPYRSEDRADRVRERFDRLDEKQDRDPPLLAEVLRLATPAEAIADANDNYYDE